MLENSILEVMEKYTYLGIEVSREGIKIYIQKKTSETKARKMMGMMVKRASRRVNICG